MRPTTVVSSANLMMWLELNLAVQSWVSSVKSSGLSTQPCWAPVLSVVVLDVLWPTRTDWGLLVRKTITNSYNHKMFNIGTYNWPDNWSTPTVIFQFVFEVYFLLFQHFNGQWYYRKERKIMLERFQKITQAGLEPTWAAWPNVIPQICTVF